jgi:hypothetical protein
MSPMGPVVASHRAFVTRVRVMRPRPNFRTGQRETQWTPEKSSFGEHKFSENARGWAGVALVKAEIVAVEFAKLPFLR